MPQADESNMTWQAPPLARRRVRWSVAGSREESQITTSWPRASILAATAKACTSPGAATTKTGPLVGTMDRNLEIPIESEAVGRGAASQRAIIKVGTLGVLVGVLLSPGFRHHGGAGRRSAAQGVGRLDPETTAEEAAEQSACS